ncbi:twin-arginine translocation signal domain-containing protein [Alkalicoccobacillus porphyridii]|uniref:Twin-arginine translocation signal domain-containing protein n=1 Tax=Alkalicoccobacillus porphyridii TaxID=2597270 RepID=A0A554A1Z0_9BACI|nr:twin-arginine translocation signal domain-containing protein [Alkalicoccobacillus porphyridii]TSB47711.1 twin-arginine translocation signal domain-containing protein [Alkalicoccobacillus porphyridii]
MEKQISRRDFLKRSGAAVFILSWAGLTWRAVDQGVFSTGKGAAYEPWDGSTEQEGALLLVNDAILASNPHNTQPWLFKVNASYIEIYADESRNLGSLDPLRREMFIGLGCAIENLMISANAHGYSTRLHYHPNPLDSSCIARVELENESVRKSELYDYIPLRQTHRGAYHTDRKVSASILSDLENLILDERLVKLNWITTPNEKSKISDLTVKATEAIIANEQMSADSNNWFKESWNEIQDERDGITLDAQGGSFFIRTLGKLLPPLSHEKNNEFWLASTKDTQTATAAAYGMILVKDAEDNEQRARAGRAWQRMHLYGAGVGLGMQPLCQLNEMADHEKSNGLSDDFRAELMQLTRDPGWNSIFIFRCGFPVKETHKSPRRSVEDVVI